MSTKDCHSRCPGQTLAPQILQFKHVIAAMTLCLLLPAHAERNAQLSPCADRPLRQAENVTRGNNMALEDAGERGFGINDLDGQGMSGPESLPARLRPAGRYRRCGRGLHSGYTMPNWLLGTPVS
jgi:hypothetical protein